MYKRRGVFCQVNAACNYPHCINCLVSYVLHLTLAMEGAFLLDIVKYRRCHILKICKLLGIKTTLKDSPMFKSGRSTQNKLNGILDVLCLIMLYQNCPLSRSFAYIILSLLCFYELSLPVNLHICISMCFFCFFECFSVVLLC